MTKFSEELIAAQLAVLFFTSGLAAYWLLVKKKKRESAEWVPASLVRAYLDRMQADERETRLKLFGEHSPAPVATTQAPIAAALGTTTVVDPNLLKEVDALRTQLSQADQRAMEFDRMMNALRAEKAALEQKLKEAPATAAAPASNPAGAVPEEVKKELDDLKAKLQEYEVIEDDLANLKKFQKENELLRQKVDQYEKGGSTAISGATAAAEPKTVVSGGNEQPAPTMTLVSGGAKTTEPDTVIPADKPAAVAEQPAQAAPAPAAQASPTPAVPEANTNVLQAVAPTVDSVKEAAPPAAQNAEAAAAAPAAEAAPAAPEKTAEQKEEELLSEFEKMLAS